jgi:uncharacterized protein involved in exopolysaccharide biosynthesis
MAQETKKKTPRDLLRAVFRRRLLFLVSASMFALTALVVSSWWPLKYTAMAKFERRADPASEDLVRGKSESFDALKMTLQHELVGTGAVEQSVDDLEQKRLLPPLSRGQDAKLTPEGQRQRQDLVRKLIDNLKVLFEVRSEQVDLVSVAFTDADPRLAQELPNILVTNYINRTSEQIVSSLTASRDFLQAKFNEVDARSVELTRKRIDYETKFAGMLPDSPAVLQQEIQRITTDIALVRRQQSLASQKVEQIRIILGQAPTPPGKAAPAPKEGPDIKPEKTPPAAPEKPATTSELSVEQEYKDAAQEFGRLQDQQQQYQKSMDEMRTLLHMTEKHPKVIAMKKQMEDMDKRIVTAKNRVADLENRLKESRTLPSTSPLPADPTLDPLRARTFELQQAQLAMEASSAQAEYQMATNEIARLEAHQADLQKVMANYGPVRQEYMGIVKEVTDQKAEVDRWQNRLNEVQMALSAEAAKHRTHLNQVELAQEQFTPSSPKLLYVLALAIVGGLAFGGGLVFLTNAVDRSIATTEEAVDHFGLPVLGTIGEITTTRQQARRRLIRWGLVPIAAVLVTIAIGIATLNIALWLNYREMYNQWRASPVQFIVTKIGDSISHRL